VLSGTPTQGFENNVRTRDGRERTLLWNVTRLLDSESCPCGIIAIGQDITERKLAKEALESRERLYRDAIAGAKGLTILAGVI
jgi:two-component system cell cycle sensor histidine kinase PleC